MGRFATSVGCVNTNGPQVGTTQIVGTVVLSDHAED